MSPRRQRKPISDPVAVVRRADDAVLDSRGLSLTRSYEGTPWVYDIAWSADASFFAATGKEGAVFVWSTATGARQRLPGGHEEGVDIMALAWHPTRSILATGGDDGRVFMWDVDSGVCQEFCKVTAAVRGLAWSPDGSTLAMTNSANDEYGGVVLWDVQTRQLLRDIRLEAFAYSPRWSPDGRVLLTPGFTGIVHVLAHDDLQVLRRLSGHASRVYSVDISRDGRFVASGSMDQTVRVWDLITGKELVTLEGQTGSVQCVQFSSDAQMLASKAQRQVRMWRCRDWECVAELPPDRCIGVGGSAFHRSLPLLAAKDNGPGRIDFYTVDYMLLECAPLRPILVVM